MIPIFDKRILIFSFLIIVSSPSLPDAATIDTSFKFFTIETGHFSVHYHQGLDDLAQKAAAIAEDIHEPMTRVFDWAPMEKTQMVLIDDTDFPNGFARAVPYNTIYLQVVPPSIDMTIGEYDDWLRTLIAHEYSHILTMDSARGYSMAMRSIFGKPAYGNDPFSFLMFLAAAPPNIFLPVWWHEGMATWGETEYTGIGRGRSSFYEMIFRMAVTEDNIPSVDQINGEVPYWPGQHMPYIFGLRLQRYVAGKYGKEALGSLNKAHAGRFPYFIKGAASGLLGKDYVALYNEMVEDLKMEEGKRIERLRQLPFTSVNIINMDGETLTNPRYSPDGRLIAFNRRDPHRHEAIAIAGRDGYGAKDAVRRLPSDHGLCWSPDSSRIYFSQAEIKRGFDMYQDLYSYDLTTGAIRRLTNGLRIKEPDISPDGGRFAVITNGRGSQNLAILEFESGGYRLNPLTGHIGWRLSGPRWSPDGRYIVYSLKDNEGRGGIHIYDVAGGRDMQITDTSGNHAYPAWSPDGKYIIYTSDKTNVYNLSAYSIEEGRGYQITHLPGGAFQPDVSADGREIIFSIYNSKGFKIAVIEYAPEKWMTTPGPAITHYWDGDTKDVAYKPYPVRKEGRGDGRYPVGDPRPYSVAETILPRFWLPTLSSDHKGGVVGAFTAGQDVIGYNTYMVQLNYGTSSGNGYYDIAYLNDYAYPTFMAEAYARPVLYSGILPDYYELNRSLILGISIPLRYVESRYRFTLGCHMQEQGALSSGIGSLYAFQGRRDNLFAGIEFSDALRYPYSVSYEEGRRVTVLHRYYSRETGSELDSREYIASYAGYLPMLSGYSGNHVVYLSLIGGASSGERIRQQAFQLGGAPQQSEYPLRGYPSGFEGGQYVATGSLEYRLPLRYILKGHGTKPFFWDRLHGAVFGDAGEVWGDSSVFSYDRLKTGAGMEARMDMALGYRLRVTPAIGVAHGFSEGGETRVYFTIYSNL